MVCNASIWPKLFMVNRSIKLFIWNIYNINFIIPYRKVCINKCESNNGIVLKYIKGIAIFVCGIVAGWTNENITVALFIMIVGFLIKYKIEGIKFQVWMFSG